MVLRMARPAYRSGSSITQFRKGTKTETGLNIACGIDWGNYPKGISIPESVLKDLNISYDDFHGDWNYTISPR
jgi:hypothetical protein